MRRVTRGSWRCHIPPSTDSFRQRHGTSDPDVDIMYEVIWIVIMFLSICSFWPVILDYLFIGGFWAFVVCLLLYYRFGP